jgi:hypothetical protein
MAKTAKAAQAQTPDVELVAAATPAEPAAAQDAAAQDAATAAPTPATVHIPALHDAAH